MIKLVYPKFWEFFSVLTIVLIPLSWLYRGLGRLRLFLVKPIRFQAKTICVGNITVGGTGKTQIVEMLAKHYVKQKKKCVIVTKAYGSSLRKAKLVENSDRASEVGDESKLLSEFAPVIAAKKIAYANEFIAQLKPEVIIFDDGLQNPGFHKDFSIMVVDSLRGFGNKHIFPAGPLREQISYGIKKCDAIITLGDQRLQDNGFFREAEKNSRPIFEGKIFLKSILQGDLQDKEDKYYLAFSAIGNPEKFFNTLRKNDIKIAMTKSFPDHHIFTDEEINELRSIAKQNNYTLITTKKDYVKIEKNHDIECAIVDITMPEKTQLIKLIDETLF